MMGAILSGRDVGIQFVKILSPITNSDKRFELIQGRIWSSSGVNGAAP